MQIGLTRSLPALRRALIEACIALSAKARRLGIEGKGKGFHGLGLLTVIIGFQCGDEA